MVGAIWFFLLPTSFGFLFDLTTPGPVNGGLKISHYNALLDIITEERNERKQMEQYIRQLETEVKKLTNITSIIQENYEHVRSELLQVQSKSTQFENCCSYSRNYTFKITGSTNKQNDTNRLASVLESTQSKVNMLLRNEMARKEDFLALYNLTLNNQNAVVKVNEAVQFRDKELRTYTDQCYNNLSVALGITENKIKRDIKVLEDKLTKESEQVAVTACATGTLYTGNSVIRFPNIRSSYGHNTLYTLKTNGKFTCDKPGLYLIIASIMTHLSDAEYQIRKNENNLVYVRVVPNLSGDQHDQYHTGTGSAVIFLNLRDNLDIHVVNDIRIHLGYSCLSILKIH